MQTGLHIDWLEWGDAAFARAATEQRPILLRIGAIWCNTWRLMEGESDAEVTETGPDSGGQTGDNVGLATDAVDAPESVDELAETGQDYEAEAVAGVEEAPPADEAEVKTHADVPGDDENPPEKL